jgi:hypothetical protein
MRIQLLYVLLMFYRIVKPILFLFPPEKAHHISITILNVFLTFPFGKNVIRKLFFIENASLKLTKKNNETRV